MEKKISLGGNMARKRMVARRATVSDITEGTYYIQEGFDPNYVVTPFSLGISRARVTGTIMDTYLNDDGNYGFMVLDDGSDTIRLKFFNETEPLQYISAGAIVEVIGKVREYNEERYIMPELVVPKDIHHELLRKIEYINFRSEWEQLVSQVQQMHTNGKSKEEIAHAFSDVTAEDIVIILQHIETSSEESETEETESAGKVVSEIIDQLDSGEGVDYSILVERAGMAEQQVESVINDFLSDGTCYEPRPGVIKKL